MVPVISHYDLLIVSAFTIAIVVAGFSWIAYLTYRIVYELRDGRDEMLRVSRAIAGLVYQEEEKTRALLREHGAP